LVSALPSGREGAGDQRRSLSRGAKPPPRLAGRCRREAAAEGTRERAPPLIGFAKGSPPVRRGGIPLLLRDLRPPGQVAGDPPALVLPRLQEADRRPPQARAPAQHNLPP